MLPFITAQAIALTHAKQRAGEGPPPGRVARIKREPLLSRAFDALVESRVRRAEIEIAHYRRLRKEIKK